MSQHPDLVPSCLCQYVYSFIMFLIFSVLFMNSEMDVISFLVFSTSIYDSCKVVNMFSVCRSNIQSSAAVQPAPVTNPFGTLPAMPQMSIGRAGTAPSVQYGISSMPVNHLS